jgi:hypothetical protein
MTALKSNAAAPTPDLSGVEFATSANGLPVARIDDLVPAMVKAPSGFSFLASAVFVRRPLTELTRADFIGHDGRVADEDEFRVRVAETAGHKRDLAKLNRVRTRMSASTPWGGSQVAVIYAEGVVAHSTAGHGGFHLSPDRNAKIHPPLRKETPWYEEGSEWAIVALSFPDLFTGYERSLAEKSIPNTRPDEWEAIHGCKLAEGESWARDRRAFDQRHAADYIVMSAIFSDQHPGMTEVVAVVGGNRRADNDERRFLVPTDEYAKRGRFGFVVDPVRHAEYQGPSSFIGWRDREDGHDRRFRSKTAGGGNRCSA